MATNYDAAVNSFYLAYYGRPADPAGLAYWSQALAQNNGDFSTIIDAFSTSAEATSRFGDATPSERIADVYQQLFNRAPDEAGLAYWTKAIETGAISIADAAIEIMHGAQTTDAQLSTLRQEAAAQFTAEVAASGTAYDGTAAIEAARVLIAAITPASSATDIKSLVAATKSLVQTAHDNPAVITALAGSGNLTTLLTSAGGKADPVAMVEALASVGKAAASDTAALATLQQGGGMAGIVNSLPSGTTLRDVAQAATQGGLGAVTDIVKPTPPGDTTPPAAPTVQLVADTGASASDHITSNGQIKVGGIEAGATWQYSADGTTWTTGPAATDGTALLNTTATGSQTLLVRSTDAAGNVSAVTTFKYTLSTEFKPTLAFRDGANGADLTTLKLLTNTDDYWVTLHGGKDAAKVVFQVSDSGKDGTWADADPAAPLTDGAHFIRYIVTDLAGNTGTTNALEVDMDKTAPAAPKVELVADTGASATDHITSNGQVKVSGIEAGATWQYSTNGTTWTTGPAATDGTALLDTSANGPQTLQVRTVDAAGNASATATLAFTLATTFTPRLAFQGPDGKDLAADAMVTNTDFYWVTLYGAKGAANSIFQISDTGADGTWVTAKDTDPLADGTHYIRYVVTDMAGNTAPSNPLKLVMNHALPSAPTVQLAQDTGASATDHITSNGQVEVKGLDATAVWSYSTNDGQSWTAGPAANTDGTALLDLGAGQHHLLVRTFEQVDGTETFSIKALDYTVNTVFNPTLAFRDGANGADLTTLKLLTNTDDYWVTLHGGKDAAKVVFQVSDSGKDGTWADADPAAPLSDGAHFIRYIVTDLAGNTGTTNALEVDMDKTAPAAPTVALVSDTGKSATDHVTTNGQVKVGGIEAGATWQYTVDGTNWITGATPDAGGQATAELASGQHTLQVRVVDAAGNASAVASMPYTLEGSAPAEGLVFDHVAGGAQGATQTGLAKADLVFAYTGTIGDGASVTVQIGAGGFVGAGNATIDTAAKTVTLHDVDLTARDPLIQIGVTSAGGLSTYSASVKIDGPYVDYGTQATDSGIALSSLEAGHVYLTDGVEPAVQVGEAIVGTATIGVQATAAQGVLGVGPGVDLHTDKAGTYGLGTTGVDTLSGQYVWGFDGDDHITTVDTDGIVYGGNGADTIDATSGSATFRFRGAQESTVAADGQQAHGFDTITVNTSTGGTGHTQVFDFGVVLDGTYSFTGTGPLTGSETGNELLALLNGAVHFAGNGKPEAAVIGFGDADVNYLAVDTNGDGQIGTADYVVKLVGTIGAAHLEGAGILMLPTA